VNHTLVWRWRRFLCACGRAATEEEAGVEAAVEETGSSSVDDGGGDQRSTERRGHREFWDEK
jgi:hypothetical protein